MHSQVIHLAAMFFGIFSLQSSALAADTLVRLEARCSDKTIEYSINQHALSKVQTKKDHKVVAGNSAEIIIRFSASPVRNHADDKGPPLGIAMATLVQRRTATGAWEVTRFGSAFVPLDDIQTTVESSVDDALK